MSQSYFNEIINGHLTVFAAWAVFLFLRFVWLNVEKGYYSLRPALAVMALLVADVVIRLPFWVSRHYINIGWVQFDRFDMPWFYITVFSGVLLKCWAVLCVIRVFAPDIDTGKRSMKHLTIWTVLTSVILVEGWIALSLYYPI